MSGRLTHVAVVLWTVASLVVSPVYAQAQEAQTQGQAQGQTQEQAQPSSQAQTQAAAPAPAQPRTVTVGADYSKGKPWFPNIISPYTQVNVPVPILTNTPRIAQLIQDGKLMLSLEDAIAIALENNLDISVQRFTPFIAQTSLLKAEAGGVAFGLGSSAPLVLGSAPAGGFDPTFTSSLSWASEAFPVNNPFLSGVVNLTALTSHALTQNFGYSQGFHTGTAFSATWNTTRSSSTAANLFNPSVASTMAVTLSQPLLRGFGLLPNTRFIIEAKNTLKVADSQFAQAVMTDVAAVEDDYWELVFARENVKVEEAAVAVDKQLYENNKKQLEIGTMAPLDVLTAESQLASDTQALVAAQTTKLQDETVLLNAITKNPLDASLVGVEIVPTTPITTPDVTENIQIQDAVKEAWQKRPEIQQAELNLKNAGIEVKATKNALLPALTLFGQYSATGLAGNSITTIQTPVPGVFVADLNSPVVDATGTAFNVGNPGSPGVPAFMGIQTFTTTKTPTTSGLGDALSAVVHNNFPTYVGGFSLTLPIRNRSAIADNARALIDERQLEVAYRQLQNSVFLSVRNALIALTQGRAQVAAAEKARTLAAQTLDAEQKKYQLGSSTSYNVVLRSRDLTTAQGNELRAKINLQEAAVSFNQAMGRTLEVNRIIVSDALRGRFSREPQIPGTPNWDMVPGNK